MWLRQHDTLVLPELGWDFSWRAVPSTPPTRGY